MQEPLDSECKADTGCQSRRQLCIGSNCTGSAFFCVCFLLFLLCVGSVLGFEYFIPFIFAIVGGFLSFGVFGCSVRAQKTQLIQIHTIHSLYYKKNISKKKNYTKEPSSNYPTNSILCHTNLVWTRGAPYFINLTKHICMGRGSC
jgi:hypothetical protein